MLKTSDKQGQGQLNRIYLRGQAGLWLSLIQQLQFICNCQCFVQSWINNSWTVSLSTCLEHYRAFSVEMWCFTADFLTVFLLLCVEGLSSRSLVSSQQVSGHSSTGKFEHWDCIGAINTRLWQSELNANYVHAYLSTAPLLSCCSLKIH